MSFILKILEGLVPGIMILGIFQLMKDPEHMEEYEKEFIAAHEDELDYCIPSGFDDENTNLLMKLCEDQVSSPEALAENPPKVDYYHIDFKKVVHQPFLVKMIRCNAKFGIIRAPGRQCAYVLKRGKSNPNIGNEMFFFYKKFCYYFRDLTFQEQEYLREMARLPDKTILDAKNRARDLIRSSDDNHDHHQSSSSTLDEDDEYPTKDISFCNSSFLFEELAGSSSSAAAESSHAAASRGRVTPPAEHQMLIPKSAELDVRFSKTAAKTDVVEDVQHQQKDDDEFTRQPTNNNVIQSTQSNIEYKDEPSGVKFLGRDYVKPTIPPDIKSGQPDEE